MRKALIPALALLAASCSGGAETTVPATASTVTTASPTTSSEAPTGSSTTSTSTLAPTTSTDPEETSTSTSTSTTSPGSALIQLDEIVLAGSPYLLIANRGIGAGSTGGHFICQFPNYYELPDVELQPGERIAVPLGEGEVPELVGVVATVDVINPLGQVNRLDGELGLYSRSEFNSPDAIIDYVEWGSPGHARSSVAAGAGIWTQDGFVEVPAEVLAIVAQTIPTRSPTDWFAEIGG